MKAEILTIGDEILIGQITNTNSVWIARQLNLIGVHVIHMASVGDNDWAILNALEAAATRADLVLITGGLGPTKDDITKKVFAKFLNTELVLDKDVLADVSAFFTKRNKEVSQLNRDQALVPKGCVVLRNKNGTAPGTWMKKGNTVFVSMPGVPYEMQGMMTELVIPKIQKDNKLPYIYHNTVLTQGIGESALAELIEVWENSLGNKNIKLAYLPQPGMVRLRLSGSGDNEQALKKKIDGEIDHLKTLIGKYIFGYEHYGEETPTLEKIVSDLLRERKKTLSLAESCTGGYITSLLTAIPGASEILKGSVVPYTNEAKHKILEVDKTIFETVGAVSRECVEELATNVLKKFDSDYSIAVSGIAGPGGGTPEKPVGLVWLAVATREKVLAIKLQFGDNRQRNIIMTANAALNGLRKIIINAE